MFIRKEVSGLVLVLLVATALRAQDTARAVV